MEGGAASIGVVDPVSTQLSAGLVFEIQFQWYLSTFDGVKIKEGRIGGRSRDGRSRDPLLSRSCLTSCRWISPHLRYGEGMECVARNLDPFGADDHRPDQDQQHRVLLRAGLHVAWADMHKPPVCP